MQDVRDAYPIIKDALLSDRYKKVVLILHSQGGIEGGLIIDWLLDEVPQDILRQLEVYTFGSAANHFNNPYARATDLRVHDTTRPWSTSENRTIGHLEHYANSGDFVSRFGVLNFADIQNRYIGPVFVQDAKGHMLNQHYLNTMFAPGVDGRTLETNTFMESDVHQSLKKRNKGSDIHGIDGHDGQPVKVKEMSRLWCYRDGHSPP